MDLDKKLLDLERTPITTDGRDQEPVSDRGNFLLADTDIDFVSAAA